MNYLALLGWSKDAETTFLSKQELIDAFEIERVSRNPARFDVEKLEWMNNHYVQSLDDDDLASRCLHFLSVAGLSPDLELLRRAMPLVKERMKTLSDSVDLLRFLFTDDIAPDEKAAEVVSKAPDGYLRSVADALADLRPWDAETIKAEARRARRGAGLNRTKGFQPVRAAVTGSTVSPPLPESLELLGRERTLERLGRPREAPLVLLVAALLGRARVGRDRRGVPDPGDVKPEIVWRKIPFGARRKRQTAAYSSATTANARTSSRTRGGRRALHGRDLVRLGVEPLRRQRHPSGREAGGLRALPDRHRRDDLPAREPADPVPPRDRDELDRDRHRARRDERGPRPRRPRHDARRSA